MKPTEATIGQTIEDAPGERADTVLSVRDLCVGYKSGRDVVPVVQNINLDVYAGETVGLVGESGSGKSSALLSLARLLPSTGRVTGSIKFGDVDLVTARPKVLRTILGSDIGMIYQDALRSLNPVMRIRSQYNELLRAHDAREVTTVDILGSVGLPDPAALGRRYPHELSGGMRQRALIGLGLGLKPRLVLADEPTTALDVTIQAQILELMQSLAQESGTATILVTHDMGVVAKMCDRVLVMYAGRIVESGATEDILRRPKHPYTASLLRALPRLDAAPGVRYDVIPGSPIQSLKSVVGCSFADRCYAVIDKCRDVRPELALVAPGQQAACLRTQADGALPERPAESADSQSSVQPTAVADGPDTSDVLLTVSGLHMSFRGRSGLFGGDAGRVRAIDGVDLTIFKGEALGLVGESGCGKSTLARIVAGLERADSGAVDYGGVDVRELRGGRLRAYRRQAQLVYQDPRSSLNRRMTVSSMIGEALAKAGVDPARRRGRVRELLAMVDLPAGYADRFAHELSGGEAQRAAIARALAVRPSLLIADEAVSSLDVSIKGQILNLLADLRRDLGLTVLFISHDLSVVRHVCDRVAVMYLGKIIEVGPTGAVLGTPAHPYTLALRSAIPVPDPVLERQRLRIILSGDLPKLTAVPSGCRFHSRCPIGPNARAGREVCIDQEPPLAVIAEPAAAAACHFADEVRQVSQRNPAV